MSKTYNFKECYEIQKKYYDLFKDWLSKKNNISQVWDGTFEEDNKGIDLYIKTNGGRIFPIQVKIDFKVDITGNLPFEVISQAYVEHASKIGAEFDYEGVEYIFFIFAKSGRIMGFKFKQILRYVIEHYNEFRNFKADNGYYKTLGCLIPIEKVKHLVTHTGNLAGG